MGSAENSLIKGIDIQEIRRGLEMSDFRTSEVISLGKALGIIGQGKD
jgi:hypothetical protein